MTPRQQNTPAIAAQADGGRIRLDKWLFYARFFKTRALAADRINGGGIRVNGQPCRKPGRFVSPGDQVTISIQGHVRAVRVRTPGTRRGPAAEAALLYDELSQSRPAPLE